MSFPIVSPIFLTYSVFCLLPTSSIDGKLVVFISGFPAILATSPPSSSTVTKEGQARYSEVFNKTFCLLSHTDISRKHNNTANAVFFHSLKASFLNIFSTQNNCLLSCQAVQGSPQITDPLFSSSVMFLIYSLALTYASSLSMPSFFNRLFAGSRRLCCTFFLIFS